MTLRDIGLRLRGARKAARLSQEDVAKPLGMSRATISALESGRCQEIGVVKLAALLDLVGLELVASPRTQRPTIDELREARRR